MPPITAIPLAAQLEGHGAQVLGGSLHDFLPHLGRPSEEDVVKLLVQERVRLLRPA